MAEVPNEDRREVSLWGHVGLILASSSTTFAFTLAILVPTLGWGTEALVRPLLVGVGGACVMAAMTPRLFGFRLGRRLLRDFPRKVASQADLSGPDNH